MKTVKRGSAGGSEPPKQEGRNDGWAGVDDAEVVKAEREIAARMATGMAIWAASLEVYQSMVRDWTRSRQNAIWKSMQRLSQIQSAESDENKVEEAAGVLVEQWSSFQQDFLALQMKTVAKTDALLKKTVEIAKGSHSEMAYNLQQTWQKTEDAMRAGETSERTSETSDK